MIKIIFYISIIFFLYYCLITYQEDFQAEIYDNTNCCVIRKARVANNFFYTYKPTQYCDDYNDNFLRTIKEGESIAGVPFEMSQCVNEKLFGSCRQLGGFTCTDFKTKEECAIYPNTVWDLKTCNDTLPYTPTYFKYGKNITQI